VPFAAGSAELSPDESTALDRIVQLMKTVPNAALLIVGHADQTEATGEALALSDARARAVDQHLVAAGVPPARLSSRAVGADDLLTTGTDPTSLALNRRTEFVITGLFVG